MHVAHIITGLGAGGAEMMLYRVAVETQASGHRHSVLSMIGPGPVGRLLEQAGIPVTTLGMRRGVPDPMAVPRLVSWLRRERPEVIQSWMYPANLLAGIAGAVGGGIPVVWGIHHTDTDFPGARRASRWTRAACARLSGIVPARIICCAEAARRSHLAIGYRADRMEVIPNGFDVERFAPDPAARARLRRELSIRDDAPVVGLVARFHPDKDHANFLAAARLVARRDAGVVFVLAGAGVGWSNPELATPVRALGLEGRVRLLGPRTDVPDLLASLDVLASSSRTEGFPNVIGEAMASGVPCAVTDCGDSREIVGEAGKVAPPRDPGALAAAILELLSLGPTAFADLARAARERVRAHYDIRIVAGRYAAAWQAAV